MSIARPSEGRIVIDTNVFGAGLAPAGNALADQYRPLMAGHPAHISFETHKTADEILDNLANYCQRINDSSH